MTTQAKQWHLQCAADEIGRYVFLPGDPARSKVIADHFDESWKVAENREMVTYTGTVKGTKVSVTSTGMGAASTAIAVEELIRLGADTFIRIGSGGGMQKDILPGDLVIATGAVRDEGVSQFLVPIEYPAVASHDVVSALIAACKKNKSRHHVGIFQSKALFYGQQRDRDKVPTYEWVESRWQAWLRANVIASEMEAAMIFTLASVRGKRSGCIATVGSNTENPAAGRKVLAEKGGFDEVIEAAVEAVRILAEWDKAVSE